MNQKTFEHLEKRLLEALERLKSYKLDGLNPNLYKCSGPLPGRNVNVVQTKDKTLFVHFPGVDNDL